MSDITPAKPRKPPQQTILKNGRTRLAFQFGRASALRSANDVIDQLQAQLDAEKKQHAFDVAASERQIALLLRDLMQAKYEIAQRNLIETFSKMESPSARLH